jgi:precorrin isomerase
MDRHQPWWNALSALASCNKVVFGVRSGLRNPRRLTVLAIAGEAPTAVFCALRVARAVQRRRPRIAVGSALVAAGAVARLRAASAEPLR